MGKVFGDNKSKLIHFIFLIFVLLYPGVASSGRELELFDSAYENYIAYRPEQAVKEFRAFLEEFPRSSAKDAAMFWLGRSLVHLEFLEESKQVFSDLIAEFPESPFREYAEKEIDMISKIPPKDKSVTPSDGDYERENIVLQEEPEESVDSIREPSEEPPAIEGGKDELGPLFEEEKEKPVGLPASEEEVEKKEAYIVTSSSVLSRLGVTYIAWRSEDILKDIENEQLLYERAKSQNILADPEIYEDLVEKYHFNSEQAEYLQKFLSICELLDRRLRNGEDERVVELLVVSYEEGDRYRKIAFSTDLQKQAKDGISFEDISKMHSGIVEFKTARFQDLEEWIKEKIFYLENNEIGVIWSEGGYMLLKPVMKKKRISCNPAEAMKPGMKDRIKVSIGALLQEIKGQDVIGTKKEK